MSDFQVRDANKATSAQIQHDIHAVIAVLVSKKGLRGRQKGRFLTEMQDWLTWLFILTQQLREKNGMPKGSDRQSTWKGFVDVKMSEQEKELFSAWEVHDDDLFVLLADAVAHGHKMSLTFNKQNDTFVASFTGNEGTKDHEGYTLSAYAGDWYLAVRALLFKHTVLLDLNWKNASDRPSERLG